VTWGALQVMTWSFWQAYCDEAYAIISNDYLTGEKETPDGFNMAQLQADLQVLSEFVTRCQSCSAHQRLSKQPAQPRRHQDWQKPNQRSPDDRRTCCASPFRWPAVARRFVRMHLEEKNDSHPGLESQRVRAVFNHAGSSAGPGFLDRLRRRRRPHLSLRQLAPDGIRTSER
jgi:hypothetical protein